MAYTYIDRHGDKLTVSRCPEGDVHLRAADRNGFVVGVCVRPPDVETVADRIRAAATAAPGWRGAPDCARCNDTGRFQENNVEGHCSCKRGRRISEIWQAGKHGFSHPDMPDPEPPDPDGAPF
jgi:hypothetical protein